MFGSGGCFDVDEFSVFEFLLFARVPIFDGAEIADDTGEDFGGGLAVGALVDFTGEIAMGGADGEGGGEAEIGEAIVFADGADKLFDGFALGDALSDEEVEDGATSEFGLEGVLQVELFEGVVGEVYGELGGVGVVGLGTLGELGMVGGDDAGELGLIELGEAIGGAFGGGGFEVVVVAGGLLECLNLIAEMIHDFEGEGLTTGSGDVFIEEVEAGFVETDDADGGEMVGPKLIEAGFDGGEVVFGVGVEIFFGVGFEHFAFDFEALGSEVGELGEFLEEVFFAHGEIAKAGEVEGDDADGAGERVGSEKTATSFLEFAVI